MKLGAQDTRERKRDLPPGRGVSGLFVLHRSVVAPVGLAFFEPTLACIPRLFPRPEPTQVPW